MRYIGQYDVPGAMGAGYLGEVRQGPDGNLYQYVQGVDGLGNPIGGFWKRFKRVARRAGRGVWKVAKTYGPQFAPLIPGVGPAVSVLTSAIPAASAMAPEMMPTAPAETPAAMPAEAMTPTETTTAGWGLGEIGIGPDGNLYQYVQGVDGLGNPIGFFRRLRRFVKRALPVVQQVASFIPHPAAQAVAKGLTVASQAGLVGHDGIGALYQAPDGTLYQPVQGLAEDEELRGLDEEEELRGLDEDEELRGFAEDEELRGLYEDEELRGLDEDEELRGLDEEEDLRGLDAEEGMEGMEGYVRQDGMSGLEAFVPQEPPQTRWHARPAQAPEIWKPLW